MRSSKNIEYVMGRRSVRDFLEALNFHIDIKELSEVGGVYDLCRILLNTYKPAAILDIGGGKRPTLAAIMSLNYKAPVYSIDPQLDMLLGENLKNFHKFNTTLMEALPKLDIQREAPILVLANHSHVSKKEIMMLLQKHVTWVYITVPCCVDNRLSDRLCLSYKDLHMHTDKNDVYIYTSDRALLTGMLGKKL